MRDKFYYVEKRRKKIKIHSGIFQRNERNEKARKESFDGQSNEKRSDDERIRGNNSKRGCLLELSRPVNVNRRVPKRVLLECFVLYSVRFLAS